jgi:hypothetical protein
MNQIEFLFSDGTAIRVEFKNIRSAKAAEEIASYIARRMELRGAVRNSLAAKYCKKSQILPFRKFVANFYKGGKKIRSIQSGILFQAKLASDFDAMKELVELFFAEDSLGKSRLIVES